MKLLQRKRASFVQTNHSDKPKLIGKWIKGSDGKLICKWISEND